WAVRGKQLVLEVSYDRAAERVFITSNDPLNWLRTVHDWVREPGMPFNKWQLAYAPSLELQLDVRPTATVQVYVFAADNFGNTIVESGSPTAPHSFVPTEAELALAGRDIRGGETGAFGRRLEELGATTSVHGYSSLELG